MFSSLTEFISFLISGTCLPSTISSFLVILCIGWGSKTKEGSELGCHTMVDFYKLKWEKRFEVNNYTFHMLKQARNTRPAPTVFTAILGDWLYKENRTRPHQHGNCYLVGEIRQACKQQWEKVETGL